MLFQKKRGCHESSACTSQKLLVVHRIENPIMQKEIKETILCFVDEIQREELVNTLELLIEKKLSPSLYELEMK